MPGTPIARRDEIMYYSHQQDEGWQGCPPESPLQKGSNEMAIKKVAKKAPAKKVAAKKAPAKKCCCKKAAAKKAPAKKAAAKKPVKKAAKKAKK